MRAFGHTLADTTQTIAYLRASFRQMASQFPCLAAVEGKTGAFRLKQFTETANIGYMSQHGNTPIQ